MSNYKVLFIPCMGKKFKFEAEFETHAEADIALNAIWDYTAMLHASMLMPDHSSMGAVLKLDDDGLWVEIDGDGNEI